MDPENQLVNQVQLSNQVSRAVPAVIWLVVVVAVVVGLYGHDFSGR